MFQKICIVDVMTGRRFAQWDAFTKRIAENQESIFVIMEESADGKMKLLAEAELLDIIRAKGLCSLKLEDSEVEISNFAATLKALEFAKKSLPEKSYQLSGVSYPQQKRRQTRRISSRGAFFRS